VQKQRGSPGNPGERERENYMELARKFGVPVKKGTVQGYKDYSHLSEGEEKGEE